MQTLILGGARSGKSALAERLAEASGLTPVYVATATAGDGEMAERIRHHQARRGPRWQLREAPLALADALREQDAPGVCLVVDCLTLWLTNLLLYPEDGRLAREREALLETLPTLRARLYLISNETGLGVVPMGELSRRFVDEAGFLHQTLAARCDRVVLTVAGLPLVLKGEPLT